MKTIKQNKQAQHKMGTLTRKYSSSHSLSRLNTKTPLRNKLQYAVIDELCEKLNLIVGTRYN